VVEGQAVVGTDQCSPHAFGELGVFDGLQHSRLRRLEETLQTTKNREGEDVIAVGLAGDNTSQIGVRSLPDCLVERSRWSHVSSDFRSIQLMRSEERRVGKECIEA